MTVPVVLGIDPQSKRLGLALVEFEPPHRAIWADTVSIDVVDAGWQYEQIAAALHRARFEEDGGPWVSDGTGGMYRLRRGPGHAVEYEITRVGIELPPYVNNHDVFAGIAGAFSLVGAECHRRWPWAPQVTCRVQQWKKGVVGKGTASKGDVAEAAINAAPNGALATVFSEKQDACDAWGIAIYAARAEIEDREAA